MNKIPTAKEILELMIPQKEDVSEEENNDSQKQNEDILNVWCTLCADAANTKEENIIGMGIIYPKGHEPKVGGGKYTGPEDENGFQFRLETKYLHEIIPTAQEFIINFSRDNGMYDGWLHDAMVAFAKMHCNEAIKAIDKNVTHIHKVYDEVFKIDKKSVHNAYPLKNIL